MHDRSVLISGIGIAGPALAWWLRRYGFEPVLVEQAPHLRAGGYIVDFWGCGYDVAGRMGLLADLHQRGYDVHEVRFVDDNGRRTGGFHAGVFSRLTGGRYVSLPRSSLSQLLWQQIDGRCEAIFGDTVTALEADADGVTVILEHAGPRRFGLVVGADGLHSAVRRLAFGRQAVFEHHLGYVVAAFEVEGYRPRDEGVYLTWGAPGLQVARFALSGDRTLILIVFEAGHGSDGVFAGTTGRKAFLKARLAGCGWEVPQILNELDRAQDLYFDRVSQIRMDRWSSGRVALVGDAAWCPSLLAGQGAALAMTGAYVLAGELAASGADPAAALARYEERLRPFITGKQQAAEKFAGSFAPRTRLGLWFRDSVTRAFNIPPVADYFLGRDLIDRFDLPDYGTLQPD